MRWGGEGGIRCCAVPRTMGHGHDDPARCSYGTRTRSTGALEASVLGGSGFYFFFILFYFIFYFILYFFTVSAYPYPVRIYTTQLKGRRGKARRAGSKGKKERVAHSKTTPPLFPNASRTSKGKNGVRRVGRLC